MTNYCYKIIFHGRTTKNESLTSTKIGNTANNIDHSTVDSLQTKTILLVTKKKILKDDVKNNQKLIDATFGDDNNIIQAESIFNESNSVTKKANATRNNAFRNDK